MNLTRLKKIYIDNFKNINGKTQVIYTYQIISGSFISEVYCYFKVGIQTSFKSFEYQNSI